MLIPSDVVLLSQGCCSRLETLLIPYTFLEDLFWVREVCCEVPGERKWVLLISEPVLPGFPSLDRPQSTPRSKGVCKALLPSFPGVLLPGEAPRCYSGPSISLWCERLTPPLGSLCCGDKEVPKALSDGYSTPSLESLCSSSRLQPPGGISCPPPPPRRRPRLQHHS